MGMRMRMRGFRTVGAGWRWKGLNRGVGSSSGPFQNRRGILTESWYKGGISPPLLPHTIPEHFSEVVSKFGDNTSIISKAQNERLTFRELDERSNVLAEGLRGRGVRKGDRVVVCLGNCWEAGVGSYGIWKAGGILVPLNPAFNSNQVISALNHLEAEHLIISTETNLPFKSPKENISLLKSLGIDLNSKGTLRCEKIPSLKNLFLVDNSSGRVETRGLNATISFSELMAENNSVRGRDFVPDEKLQRDEIINIQFTSGTTSTPKAACLTHHNILNNGYFIGERMGLVPEDVICVPPPLYHCFGSVLGYMATITHGSAILWGSEAFNPVKTMEAVKEERATGLYGVATMFLAELELVHGGKVRVEEGGFERLKKGIAAGSSVPVHLMEKLERILGMRDLTICYGMTETSPVSCMTSPHDEQGKRWGSVGRFLEHVEGKVVDDTGRVVEVGKAGELVVSGYSVMKGYWNDPDRTQEVRIVERVLVEDYKSNHVNNMLGEKEGVVSDEGLVVVDGHVEKVWMHTGDEAVMDEDGFVRITGRIKDLIIRGGENIHPLEVEECLFGMEEVSEVSVVGLADERYGEVVGAFVRAHDGVKVGRDDSEGESGGGGGEGAFTTQMVKDWVRKELSGHLVPKWVFWVGEEGFPKTASGKIQKFKLRELGDRFVKEVKGKVKGGL